MSDHFDEPFTDSEDGAKAADEKKNSGESKLAAFWNSISNLGITEPAIRIGTHILTIGVIVAFVLILSSFYLKNVQESNQTEMLETALAIAAPTVDAASGVSPEEAALGASFPAFTKPDTMIFSGIPRFAEPETVIPSRPRVEVTTYEVQQGDSVFSIADQFGLKPETILWGNYSVLQDNPRFLAVGQVLNILPVDGTYHQYSQGESLTAIAQFFKVDPTNIVEWPGNHLDPYDTNVDSPPIADGTWLIIPGGKRDIQDWGPPAITRANPAVARYYGEGSCGEIYEGAIGNGTFIWPTTETWLSGYDYDANIHPAIDIAGSVGNAVYATDSGVIVYAGWSNYGYGNLIVIDHGTGWQSAYAHLSSVGVYCGQSVAQGDVIGAVGSTGNSSGAHLHFELLSSIYGKVNPFDFLIHP